MKNYYLFIIMLSSVVAFAQPKQMNDWQLNNLSGKVKTVVETLHKVSSNQITKTTKYFDEKGYLFKTEERYNSKYADEFELTSEFFYGPYTLFKREVRQERLGQLLYKGFEEWNSNTTNKTLVVSENNAKIERLSYYSSKGLIEKSESLIDVRDKTLSIEHNFLYDTKGFLSHLTSLNLTSGAKEEFKIKVLKCDDFGNELFAEYYNPQGEIQFKRSLEYTYYN